MTFNPGSNRRVSVGFALEDISSGRFGRGNNLIQQSRGSQTSIYFSDVSSAFILSHLLYRQIDYKYPEFILAQVRSSPLSEASVISSIS